MKNPRTFVRGLLLSSYRVASDTLVKESNEFQDARAVQDPFLQKGIISCQWVFHHPNENALLDEILHLVNNLVRHKNYNPVPVNIGLVIDSINTMIYFISLNFFCLYFNGINFFIISSTIYFIEIIIWVILLIYYQMVYILIDFFIYLTSIL